MNNVVLIGRLTRDPEVRYTSETQMAVARFSVAIDRPVRSGDVYKRQMIRFALLSAISDRDSTAFLAIIMKSKRVTRAILKSMI